MPRDQVERRYSLPSGGAAQFFKGVQLAYKHRKDIMAAGSYVGKKVKQLTQNKSNMARKSQPATKRGGRRRGAPVNRSQLGSGNIHTVATRVKKRAPKPKRKRMPKVSSVFRNKVKSALKDRLPKGFFQETHYGMIELDADARYLGYGIPSTAPVPATFGYDKQWVYNRTNNPRWDMNMFTYEEIMDAAAVLFKNKIGLLVTAAGVNQENYEQRSLDPTNLNTDGVLNGLMWDKFNIIDSSVTYTFKNNSKKRYELLIYLCSPKTKTDRDTDAVTDWHYGMVYENTGSLTILNEGQFGIGIAGDNQVAGLPNCTNIGGAEPYTLGATPYLSPRFTGKWKAGCKKVILEAGQIYVHVVPGPKNVLMDPTKWRKEIGPSGEASQNVSHTYKYHPRFSQSMICVIKPEILPTGNGGAGRFADSTNTSGLIDDHYGIAVEKTKYFKLEMPETAGSSYLKENIATGLRSSSLLNRKPAYYLNTWRYNDQADAIKIDPQQPSTEETALL